MIYKKLNELSNLQLSRCMISLAFPFVLSSSLWSEFHWSPVIRMGIIWIKYGFAGAKTHVSNNFKLDVFWVAVARTGVGFVILKQDTIIIEHAARRNCE